jgi:Flp pilus assembly protein TadB
MSKERARRRAARQHEAALRASARAAEAERRERRDRRTSRPRSLGRVAHGLAGRRVGRADGTLARRRRRQRSLLVAALVALNLLVWVLRPDWESRLGALVVSVLAAPVLATMLLPRRR